MPSKFTLAVPNFLFPVFKEAPLLNFIFFAVRVIDSVIPATLPLILNLPVPSLLAITPLAVTVLPSILFTANVSPALNEPVTSLTLNSVCPAPFNPVDPFTA